MPRKTAFKCYFGCTPYKGRVHHFPPSEYPYEEKFSQWKMVLNETDIEKGDKYIYNNIHICDHHFEEFYITATGRLTKNAILTLNIETHQAANHGIDLTTCSTEHTKISDIADANSGQGTTCEIEPVSENPPVVISQKRVSVKKGTKSSKVKCSNECAQLKIKLLKLKEKCKTLNQKVKQAAKLSQNKAFLKAVEKLSEPAAIFTNMQLKKSSIKSRGRRYTNKEKILCLTIYKQSQKAYKLMQRLFALPSTRTIQKILNRVTIKPGINEVVIQHLKKAVQKLPQEKKLCTLIFDEVALTPGLYYHKSWDMIIGFEDFGLHKTNKIADHALVFMVKSLKGKYKQPISFTFCQSTTKTTELKNIVKEVLTAVC